MERISWIGKAVGEPYRGKPDVRFDEGDLRKTTRPTGLRHQTERSWKTVPERLNCTNLVSTLLVAMLFH
jgi:hypothetical protein